MQKLWKNVQKIVRAQETLSQSIAARGFVPLQNTTDTELPNIVVVRLSNQRMKSTQIYSIKPFS